MVAKDPSRSSSIGSRTSSDKPRLSSNGSDEEHALHELTLVNPCHAAPPPMAELQPFSSRQSRKEDYVTSPGDHAGIPTIPETGEEKDSDAYGNQGGQEGNAPTMSKARMFLVASGMMLTYFLGVSPLGHT
jgi:hypothetical protein